MNSQRERLTVRSKVERKDWRDDAIVGLVVLRQSFYFVLSSAQRQKHTCNIRKGTETYSNPRIPQPSYHAAASASPIWRTHLASLWLPFRALGARLLIEGRSACESMRRGKWEGV